jgi:hypothetical protein
VNTVDLGQQCSKSTIGLVPVSVFGPPLDHHPFESSPQASFGDTVRMAGPSLEVAADRDNTDGNPMWTARVLSGTKTQQSMATHPMTYGLTVAVLARISHPVRRGIHLARGDGSSHSLQIALSVG